MIAYERVEPEGHCVSPDGHEWTEEFRWGRRVPERIWCPRCSKSWAVVTFEADDGEEWKP